MQLFSFTEIGSSSVVCTPQIYSHLRTPEIGICLKVEPFTVSATSMEGAQSPLICDLLGGSHSAPLVVKIAPSGYGRLVCKMTKDELSWLVLSFPV